jgi:hypothetical protein
MLAIGMLYDFVGQNNLCTPNEYTDAESGGDGSDVGLVFFDLVFRFGGFAWGSGEGGEGGEAVLVHQPGKCFT